MNQIFEIAKQARLRLVCALLISVAASQGANAQGNFVPAQNNSQYGQWSPPNSSPNDVVQASAQADVAPPKFSSFPSEPVAFDPGIRTAKLDMEVEASATATDESVDSTLDSTANMFFNLKDATSEKLSGLVGTLNQDGSLSDKIKSLTGATDVSKMLGSLALVLGLYFGFVWVMRKIYPEGNRGLPAEVIEVMGQVPFGPKRNLQLVRLGSKLLLLMNSPDGTQPIGEITDPTEVEYLASLCPGNRKKNRKHSPTESHFTALQQAAKSLVNASTPPQPAPATPVNNSNLANILRTLEQAAKPNTAVFEA